LALDICPVHGDTGGPAAALERPARTSPARAAATAMDKTATGLTRSREDAQRVARYLFPECPEMPLR
jgi:hypothetical protein